MQRAGLSLWSTYCISTDKCKENKEVLINVCVRNTVRLDFAAGANYLQIDRLTALFMKCFVYNGMCMWHIMSWMDLLLVDAAAGP